MTTKPLRISKLDLSNPLTRGLVFCAPLNEQAGLPMDCVTQTRAATLGGASWSPYGIVPVASDGAYWSTNAGQFGTASFTCMIVCSPISGATAKYELSNSYTTLNRWAMISNIPSNGGFEFYAQGRWASAAGMSDGLSHVFIGVRSGANHYLYRDGALVGSGGGPAISTDNAGNAIALGYGGLYSTSPKSCAMVWNRALSAPEIAQISGNPWQVLVAQSSARSLLAKMFHRNANAFDDTVFNAATFATGRRWSGLSRGRILSGLSRGRILN